MATDEQKRVLFEKRSLFYDINPNNTRSTQSFNEISGFNESLPNNVEVRQVIKV